MLCASSEVVGFVAVCDSAGLISRSFSEALLIEVNFAWSAVHDFALLTARSSFEALSIIVIFAGSAVRDSAVLISRSSFKALLTVVIFAWLLRVLVDNALSDLSDCLSSCFILNNVLLMKGSVMFLFKFIDMSLRGCSEACSSDVS